MAKRPGRPIRNTDIPARLLAGTLRLPRTDPIVRNAWELQHLAVRWDDDPIAAVYAIIDTLDRDVYFGETSNVYRRKRLHDAQLRAQTHHNQMLCNACRGIDNLRWRFVVLEEDEIGKCHRLERQAWWIVHVPGCLNTMNDQLGRESQMFR